MDIAQLCLRLRTLPEQGGLFQQHPMTVARLKVCIQAIDEYKNVKIEQSNSKNPDSKAAAQERLNQRTGKA